MFLCQFFILFEYFEMKHLCFSEFLALEDTSNRYDTDSLINALTLCPPTVNLIDDPSINTKGG